MVQLLANRYRGDLRLGGVGSGHHAFEAVLPDKLRLEVQLRGTDRLCVRRIVDGAELPSALPGARELAA